MSTISSTGIGSGLDVNSIVSQLVALEKQPLKALTVKATTVQAQMSSFGQVQSQFAALTDVATRLSAASAWTARSATSSNTSVATISVTAAASATSFSIDVDALAKQQSISSDQLPASTAVGAGTLTFRLGTWASSAFTPGTNTADVGVTVSATDTVADIAQKINKADAGVVATAFNDGTKDRLLLRSKDTGEVAGFRVQASDADGINNDNAGLSRLAFDPETGAFGMASAGVPVQYGQNAMARINGLSVTSASNTLASNMPGVTISLVATTTTGYGTLGEVKAPITMSISDNVTPAVKNVSDFVAAYNTLNKTLSDLTKYDAGTKTAGLFQGDSSLVGLQNVLRNITSSYSLGATSQRLSDVGIERQLDGSLTINTNKLSTAANNGTTLQQLFTNNNNNAQTNGFALKFADLGRGVAATGGALSNKASSLQSSLDRNTKEQSKVSDRAAMFEARVRKQYSTLDTQMAKLTALNSYVAQQVTQWNKTTG